MTSLRAEETSSKEEEPFGLGCALDYFSDYEEVLQMIDNLQSVIQLESSSPREKAYEKFSFILGQYIEQPHLLDSHIDSILEKFITIIRNNDSSLELKHVTFKYMFVLVNVRGYKDIVKHLPHEVADFEPVLCFLEAQNPNDTDTWTTRYILLLWLSIIIMIPFDLSRFDGFDKTDACKKPIMERVLDIIKTYAVVPDKCRDAAAFLSYKFINRNDVKEKHLSSFIEWVFDKSLSKDSNVFIKYGTLACIAMIIKHGKREDILQHAPKILSWIINSEFKESSGTSVQKLVYKIVQRIGLTFLPPRLASWRYQRGNRSLAANLSAAAGDLSSYIPSFNRSEEQPEEQFNVPDEVEEVIDQLIQGLRCADSVVRWSAAKGVGRVTSRLPKDLADEVVGSVLELLGPRENDGAWHGGCIALAELGRRGLLLPERLPQVVPLVLKALVYDEPKGFSSVGSHIRDAACYVCWAFARAYEPHDLAPYVQDIASTLLIVTCFDKEINCRRAASAAFQENVGRQGTFPHGIEILTTADFYAVSVRNNAYLNISVFIAQFQEYTVPLIDHLVSRKVDHWDCAIRELTSKALHNLTPQAPSYMIEKVLPELFEKTQSIDLNCRHGSVLAIGQIVFALSRITGDVAFQLNDDLMRKVKDLIPKYTSSMYFRGLGGELMKQACSDFIEKCSLAKLPLHNDDVIEKWLTLLNECLSYEVANVRLAAVSALPFLLNEYMTGTNKTELTKSIISHYVSELNGETRQSSRMGHALALGSLPKHILHPNLDVVISALIGASTITAATIKWAESRRDAVKALTSVVTTMSDEIGKDFHENYIAQFYSTLFEGLKDYSEDKRGDIGAWVREACVTGLQVLTLLLTEKMPQILTSELMNKILSNVAQQAVEKIDRTRALAGKVFFSFIYNNPRVPNIEYHDQLSLIFPKEECGILNWNSGGSTFPKFVQLLRFSPFTYHVLLGLVCSVGGLTESLVKKSGASLFTYLKEEEKSKGLKEIKRICETVHTIFVDHQKCDRITVPMFRFLDKLIDSQCISGIIEDTGDDFTKRILKLVQMEIAGCRDIYKLMDGISLMCQFIQVPGEVSQTALVQLSILLCHRQTYVRRSTASRLYESLLVNGDCSGIPTDNLDEIMQILSDTNWECAVEEVRPVRNKLCQLMGVRVPTQVKKKT
ncbi:tubulin-specific chaperone D [Anthonomus grandis grandis]|uniref:tubulin-specific chaperone D n=1 Tax=Anthonomus grandis grandis TaxID=2921223 RepID=UPI002166173D|nr:tubulin-specific chaperone D [Anthonomus grandis grandis]